MKISYYKEEYIFVGLIILLLSIWKLLDFMNIHYTNIHAAKQKSSLGGSSLKEGLTSKERKDTENIISKTDQILADATDLILKNKKSLNVDNQPPQTQTQGFLGNMFTSTEGYTPLTSEHEMTINQRRQSATELDKPHDKPIDFKGNSGIHSLLPVREGLESNTTTFPLNKKLTSLNKNDAQSKFKLRDYYIKAAYNCFNTQNFKDTDMSTDGILYVLSRGCRVIDFEVYSVDNKPVIASSSTNEYSYKESYNHIPLSEGLEIIGNYGFTASKCPNPDDPLIIHMRIMSQNITMYDNMADIIKNSKGVASRLLGPKYGNEYYSKDLGNENLLDFSGKIIIIVDKTNPIYTKTALMQFVNMSSNTLFLSKRTFFDVRNIDAVMFKESNKKNMCLVLPEKSGKAVNEGHNGPYTWGCQIVAMCFQEPARDEKLKAYEGAFDSVGYAFLLKPKELRYEQITIAPPIPPNPNASFEGKPFQVVGGIALDPL
jgi:hypothetical protein